MRTKSVFAGRWTAVAALLIVIWLTVQVATALAASPDMFASAQTVAQTLPTPTPFRFLTPTPFVPRPITTTGTAPQAGGFPMELAFPILAVGLVAIGGGSLLLRRKPSR